MKKLALFAPLIIGLLLICVLWPEYEDLQVPVSSSEAGTESAHEVIHVPQAESAREPEYWPDPENGAEIADASTVD